MLLQCCTQYASQFGNLSSGHRTGKGQFCFIPIPKKGNAKECSNYRTIALISHASKVMLKILQARLQRYVNHEFPDVQAGFRKAKRTHWSWQTPSSNNTKDDSTDGHHQMVNTEIRLIILFAAEDGKAQFSFQSQRKQCQRMFKIRNNCTHLTS